MKLVNMKDRGPALSRWMEWSVAMQELKSVPVPQVLLVLHGVRYQNRADQVRDIMRTILYR